MQNLRLYLMKTVFVVVCRYIESRKHLEIDWTQRQEILKEITEKAKFRAKKLGNSHDCIIPVGGGKKTHTFKFGQCKNCME